jgi:hypothetical protein
MINLIAAAVINWLASLYNLQTMEKTLLKCDENIVCEDLSRHCVCYHTSENELKPISLIITF